MNRILIVAALVGVTVALPLEAQGRGRGQGQTQTQNGNGSQSGNQAQGRGPVAVPPGQWPSAGKCRIWIDGVPAGRQPTETDCATARRSVPANGRVLEGSARTTGNRDDRYGRSDRYGRNENDRDDDRATRRFIDRNGLECEEKAVTKNGKRSYDLKCREPKNRNQQNRDGQNRDGQNRDGQNPSWPPVRAQDGDRNCVDTNRDGRCDSGTTRGYPTTLPDMVGAIVYGKAGQRTPDVSRWLGTGQYSVRYTDENRDQKPERVRWLDGAGSLLQEWTDTNRDGRADVVNVYSAGRLVQSIGGR